MTSLPPVALLATAHPAEPDGGIGVFHTALHRHRMIQIFLAPHIPADEHGRERGAVTDRATGRIFLAETLSLGEMRAAVVHELAHLAHPDADESTVEHITACSLVPAADARAVHDGACPQEVAARLSVDAELVECRAEGLRPLAV